MHFPFSVRACKDCSTASWLIVGKYAVKSSFACFLPSQGTVSVTFIPVKTLSVLFSLN